MERTAIVSAKVTKLLLLSLFIAGIYNAAAQTPQELGEVLSSKFDILQQRYPHDPNEPPVHFSWFFASDEESQEVVCRSFVPADWEALKEVQGLAPFIKWHESEHGSAEIDSSGYTVVSGSWLKFALAIVRNTNWKEGESYILMVDQLVFVVKEAEGGRVFHHAKILKAGDYCGLPFVYVLPPEKTYLRYEPRLDNPLENLALYIDGLPLIENTADSGSDISLPEIPKPEYEIELTLTGRFISEQGETVAPFIKHVSFGTSE